MLNWDDEIQLSRVEVEQARRLALTTLDKAIADADHLLAKVYRLNASPERAQLIEKVIALREEQLAIKRARLAQLDRLLPADTSVVPIRAADLAEAFNRYDFADYKVIRRNGSVVSFEPSKVSIAVLKPGVPFSAWGRVCSFRSTRTRGLIFVRRMLRRKASSRLASSCKHRCRLPYAASFLSRSVASRSRMLAPVGAPPLDC